MVTLFFNSCSHGLQKLNCYNHVFLSTWFGLKFCDNLKNKIQVLESR